MKSELKKRHVPLFVFLTLLLSFTLDYTILFATDSERERPGVVWLLIHPGARANGMGEAYVALADDATAPYWNPAGMAFIKKHEISLMHSNWLPQLTNDLYYEYLGTVNEIKDLGNIGGHITFLSEGEQEETNERGEVLGKFWSYETCVSTAFGTQVMPNMGVGIAVKLIYSHLYNKSGGTGIGFAADLGYLHKIDGSKFPKFMQSFTKGFNYGVALQNIGPNIVYSDAENGSPLPLNLLVGVAYRVIDTKIAKGTLVFDYNKLLVGIKDSFSQELKIGIEDVGAEFTYYDLVSIRLGYKNDSDGRVQGMTYGMGLQYSLKKKIDMRFDFAGTPQGEFATGNLLEKSNKKFSFAVCF